VSTCPLLSCQKRKLTQHSDVTNEGTVFTPKNINNYNDVNNFLKNNFVKLTASQLAQIDHLYPQAEQFPNAGAYWRTAANAYGDMRYMCPGIWVSTIFDKHALSAWVYHWDIAPQSNIDSGLGVVHCDEVNSIWNTATALPESALNPTIQSYWASFIRTQDPNKLKLSSAPEWQRLDSVGLQRMHFVADPTKVAMEAVAADYYSRCNYLTSIGGELGQ
jgi:carboxylesterase type B